MEIPVTDSNYKTLNYSVASGIARIELDKPPLNLIDEESALEYHSALRAADADENAKVLISAEPAKAFLPVSI